MRFASRMSDLGTETAFVVLAKARQLESQGRTVVHLEIGEPDFETPAHIVDEAVRALKGGATHYGPSPGIPEARQAIARYVSETRGVPVDMDRVVITPGAKPIMFYTILALVDEGDEVIYPNPGFPIYESVISFVGGRPVPIKLREENDFRLDVDELLDLVTDRTKLIIINSPQNPTGSILTAEDLRAVGRLAMERDIYVLADEIYSRIIYEGEHRSILHEVPDAMDNVILLDGMSKTFAMTGWRLGWGVMHPTLAAAVAKLQTNSNSCTATFSQMVIPPALFGPQEPVEAMRTEFQKRRDIIVDGLNSIDRISCRRPSGAFYVFPNVTRLGIESQVLADRLLQEGGVAALSGTAFGRFGEGYLRFSYANSITNIKLGLERIAEFVSKL
ncbi:MAG: pyridoxal phosphate-dependent aminotransferase [candidate division Zixibacteria bacterium]|nr:pyridoxal phosphate-dependent aminotransferase [candidate division Zixibacteria bacterium]